MLENIVLALLVIPASILGALSVFVTMYFVAKALGFHN